MEVDHPTAGGFTLPELLVALVAGAVLLALAVPAFDTLLDRERLHAARNETIGLIRAARMSAVRHRQAVTLCPVAEDPLQCSGDWRSWHRGMLLFIDSDRDRRRTAGEPVLRRHPGFPALRFVRSSPGRRSLRFLPDGSARGNNMTLSFCTRGARAAALVIHTTGRLRPSDTLADGSPISCEDE